MFHVSNELDVITLVAIGIPLLLLAIAAFVDIARRPDLTMVARILWAALIVVTAYIGVAIYFIARPPRPPDGKRYDQTAPRSSAVVDELERLRSDHRVGVVDAESYLARKREILGLDTGST
jgi:hypothetical protein